MSVSALTIITTINDLSMALNALAPIAHSMIASGQKEITLEDFSASLGDLGSKIAILEQVIAAEKASQGET